MHASPGTIVFSPVSTFGGTFGGDVVVTNPWPYPTEVVASLLGPTSGVISSISMVIPGGATKHIVVTPPSGMYGQLMLDVGNSSGVSVPFGGSMGAAGVFLLQ